MDRVALAIAERWLGEGKQVTESDHNSSLPLPAPAAARRWQYLEIHVRHVGTHKPYSIEH